VNLRWLILKGVAIKSISLLKNVKHSSSFTMKFLGVYIIVPRILKAFPYPILKASQNLYDKIFFLCFTFPFFAHYTPLSSLTSFFFFSSLFLLPPQNLPKWAWNHPPGGGGIRNLCNSAWFYNKLWLLNVVPKIWSHFVSIYTRKSWQKKAKKSFSANSF